MRVHLFSTSKSLNQLAFYQFSWAIFEPWNNTYSQQCRSNITWKAICWVFHIIALFSSVNSCFLYVISGAHGSRVSPPVWRLPDCKQLSRRHHPCLGLSQLFRPKCTYHSNVADRATRWDGLHFQVVLILSQPRHRTLPNKQLNLFGLKKKHKWTKQGEN